MSEYKEEYRVSRSEMERDLRSPLLLCAGIFLTAAAALALPGIFLLFDGERTRLFLTLLELDFIDSTAALSWLFVRVLTNCLALLVPAAMAVGLWLTVAAAGRRRGSMPLWGVKYFMTFAKVVLVILYSVSGLLALLFLFRAIRYILASVMQVGGFLFIFAMLLPELVLACVVTVILILTVAGVRCMIRTMDNIHLNMLTGRPDSYGLNTGAVMLQIGVAVAAVALCVVDRKASAAPWCFVCSAVGHGLIAAWLTWYRRKTGRRALEQFRAERDHEKNTASP